jgi:Rps23 Pro-64 3,4-dihydroxylase Tpa1-like proline 4-hydroxylase
MESATHQPHSQTIKVQLLLTGGHYHTVYLRSDEPLMYDLVNAIVHQVQNPGTDVAKLFQIPIELGHASLCFPSRNLIGLITEPPLILQSQALSNAQPQSVQTAMSDVLPSHFLQLDNFLSNSEQQNLLNYVFQKKSAFVPSSTSTQDLDYRRSLVLHSFTKFSELLINRVRKAMPDVCEALQMKFEVGNVEAQLTAHNDGNYYKVHNDSGSPDTATRELTFVYYFYREPKSFSGGELVIYDSKIENNYYVKADSFQKVEPRNNSIVFFPSYYMHEVLPIHCPSQAFADSRFTINGWIRRAS